MQIAATGRMPTTVKSGVRALESRMPGKRACPVWRRGRRNRAGQPVPRRRPTLLGEGRTEKAWQQDLAGRLLYFAVFCETEGDAQAVIGILADWLRLRGLTLSTTKTRVVHLTDGFDFLGFTIKHYTAAQTNTGYKLLITPSATAVRQLRERLRADWLAHKGASVEAVVRDLNPIIRGWANYYRVGVASHPRKSWQWRQRRYWGRLHPQRQDHWVFGDKHTGSHLLKFRWFKIERHVLVRGTASRDDPALRAYWRDRDKAKATDLSPSKQRIARAQGYTCRTCGESLFNDEELHKHHIESRATGGKDSYDNLTLEHLYCHQQKHSDATAQPARAVHEPTRSWLRSWLA